MFSLQEGLVLATSLYSKQFISMAQLWMFFSRISHIQHYLSDIFKACPVPSFVFNFLPR